MNCANHPELTAAAFCRECGKPMCTGCQRQALGSVYCSEHLPAAAPPPPPYTAPYAPPYAPPPPPSYASPYSAHVPPVYPVPADPAVHPLLALILGFFPGVGAIYNGQYAKGLIHAVIFGLLVGIVSNAHHGSTEAFVGIMIAAWVIYQAFEAYHTARKRRYGVEIEEFSSLIESRGPHHAFPIGAILLIGIGFLLLLDTTGIVRMEDLERYWPVMLIVIGIYMLYSRLSPSHADRQEAPPMNDRSQYLVRAVTGPIVLITVGVLFAIDRNFPDLGFGRTWPVLLIVIGMLKLVGGRRRDRAYYPPPPPPGAAAGPHQGVTP